MSSSAEDVVDLEHVRLADTQYLGKGHLSVNRLLRATWLGGAAGIAAGGALEYVRSSNSSSQTLLSRRLRAVYNVLLLSLIFVSQSLTRYPPLLSQTDSLRADDHATIGALLCAVLIPTIFWRRGTAVHLIFGGAGLGTAAGYFTHVARSASGDVPTKPIVSQITSDS
ncbi:hypothetical protein B0F90DRAFT_1814590 [Multifurca ochricompacta]|uniref:Uncharacterized protein n=1 Tax=Multifurca ochricompacta TaxID=376703 RepID=A0AAD4QPC9_9AGAM|nr:hypothetical protein B0F90DRAFT_1814590 [Multifurca ochricompacta]